MYICPTIWFNKNAEVLKDKVIALSLYLYLSLSIYNLYLSALYSALYCGSRNVYLYHNLSE